MEKGIYTTCYIITIVFVLGYMFEAQNIRRCYNIGFDPYIFVSLDQGEISVINEEEFYETYKSPDKFSGVSIRAWPQHSRGPLKEGFTFYYTTSFMSDKTRVSIDDWGDHSEQQLSIAYEAALQYAQQNPYYADLRPGEPPQTFFSRGDAIKCGVGFISVLGLPALAAWMMSCFAKAKLQSSFAYRRENLMCIHCAYSIRGLDSHICPECGQLHGSSTEAIF